MIRRASDIVQFSSGRSVRPNSFTTRDAFINEVRQRLLTCGSTYKTIAEDCKLSPTTIQRLATGDTRWPSHKTLWSVLGRLGVEVTLTPIR
jgi:hypothetical protein